MKHPLLVSEKSGKAHTMLCTESSDVTFHGTYDKVVENFSHVLAVKSGEKITIAKNNPSAILYLSYLKHSAYYLFSILIVLIGKGSTGHSAVTPEHSCTGCSL